MEEINRYITVEYYTNEIKSLKSGQSKNIYSDTYVDIEIKKVGRKIYTFVNKYGEEKLNTVLNNICSLV
ncbi:hypothetical protein PMY56_03640 [Clostridium tertium]|uniref:hypothetical protein n=1 Tax=Clostridium tertium TaxID=1559 RepID=UPI00232FB7EB|nr:hypothetical protein [Clostridium tertium]MDB1921080.1 hypothetical protein [Clostridium tertium]MDB1925222.1 hypothetical protein [Clostridium tertium]MDB1930308.1 hypothetical protein [Clostridium tertium]